MAHLRCLVLGGQFDLQFEAFDACKDFGVKIAAQLTDVQRQTIVRRTDAIRLSEMRAAR
jgi:hypothetical protein